MEFMEYVKPELMALIPALNGIGFTIKTAKLYNNRFIPITLLILGIILAGVWVFATSVFNNAQDVAMGIFIAVVQGALCALGAVGTNQLVKQFSQKGDITK